MSSKRAHWLWAVALAGCADDPTIVRITASATEQVSLSPGELEGVSDRDVEFHWELSAKPDASTVAPPDGNAIALFTPDRRGTYVVDRWLRYGVSDRLTHQFVITVQGIAPLAAAEGNTAIAVGASVQLDASKSQSPEGLPLTYQWRLAERPRDSMAVLADSHAMTTTFVSDVVGDYAVELAVFDGQLWSEMPAKLLVTAQ